MLWVEDEVVRARLNGRGFHFLNGLSRNARRFCEKIRLFDQFVAGTQMRRVEAARGEASIMPSGGGEFAVRGQQVKLQPRPFRRDEQFLVSASPEARTAADDFRLPLDIVHDLA